MMRVLRNIGPLGYWGGATFSGLGAAGARDGTRDARPRTDRAPTLGLVDVATLRRWPSSPLPSSRASTRSWRPAWRAGAGALRWRNVSSARAPPPRAQALKRAVPKKNDRLKTNGIRQYNVFG